MVTTGRLRRVLSIFNWTDYRLTFPVQHGCKSSSISTCMEYVVNTCVLVNPDLSNINCSLWINLFKSFVHCCHFLNLFHFQALSRRLKSPTTNSTGNAIVTSPLNTRPTRISGRNTSVNITLMMLQLALNAKPIILPKIQKKNIVKSSDNMIPHHPFSN